jgi:O-antigen ligase
MSDRNKYFFMLLAAFIITAPSDGVAGLFNVYLRLSDENYRIFRYGVSFFVFVVVAVDSKINKNITQFHPIIILLICNYINYVFALESSWALIQATVMAVSILSALSLSVLYRNVFIKFFVHLSAITMWSSLCLALLLPNIGTLSEFQVIQASLVGEPGSWLGVFSSKNALGHAAGVCAAVILLYGRASMTQILYKLTFIITVICLIKSESGSGVIIFASGLLMHYLIGKFQSRGNILVFIAVIPVALLTLLFVGEVFSVLVLNYIEKDITLTGRTDIWEYGIYLIANEAWPLGFGFGYAWSIPFIGEMLRNSGVPHLHSAYLELALNLGAFSFIYVCIISLAIYRGLIAHIYGNTQAIFCLVVLSMCLISGISEPLITRPFGYLSFAGLLILCIILSLPRPSNESRSAQ